jgi:hypothetical protein
MAGTFVAKVLAHGSIASGTATDVYTVPASTTAYVKTLLLHTTAVGASSETIVYLNTSGSNVALWEDDFSATPSADETSGPARFNRDVLKGSTLILETGDIIRIDPGVGADPLNYYIGGLEET